MDRAAIHTMFETWIYDRFGIPAFKENSSSSGGKLVTGTRAIVSILSPRRMGASERRSDDIPAGPAGEDRSRTVVIWRTSTLGIKIETSDQRAGYDAEQILDNIENALEFPTSGSSFRAQNVAIGRVLGRIALSRTISGRVWSIARLDVEIRTVDIATDDPGTWIETVQINPRSTLRDPAGNLLPDDVQISGIIDIT